MAAPKKRRRLLGEPPGGQPEDNGVPSRVRQLAGTVKAAYVMERTFAGRVTYGPHYVYTPPKSSDGTSDQMIEDAVVQKAKASVWITLAQKFIEREIEPRSYIACVFADWAAVLPPEPNHLLSIKLLEAYDEMMEHSRREVEISLETQKSVARRNVVYVQQFMKKPLESACASTIVSSTLELSPLFRYCFASSLKGPRFSALAKQYEVEASIQFVRYQKQYEQIWREELPRGFPGRARAIYSLFYEGLNVRQEKG